MTIEIARIKRNAADLAQQRARVEAYVARNQRTLTKLGLDFTPELIKKHWANLDPADRVNVVAAFLCCDEQPHKLSPFLVPRLRELRDSGILVFDGETARNDFGNLPDSVTAYRGTVVRELDRYTMAISWTLDRKKAEEFAAKRTHIRGTPPEVLSVEVKTKTLCGLLYERGEQEVLLALDGTNTGVSRENYRLPADTAA